eukprot:gene12029-7346_t
MSLQPDHAKIGLDLASNKLGISMAKALISMAPRVKNLESEVGKLEETMAEVELALEAAVTVSQYLSRAPGVTADEIQTPVHPSLR